VEVFGVPFEATASYRPGSSTAPTGVLEASAQIDLFDLETEEAWRAGIAMHPIDERIYEWNRAAIELHHHPEHEKNNEERDAAIAGVTGYSELVNGLVYEQTCSSLRAGRIPGIIGGEHSIAYGAIKAAAELNPGLGVLQVDAHADMRCAYEGLTYSHASLFYNVMKNTAVDKLVQVGIRDIGVKELEYGRECGERVQLWTDYHLQRRLEEGTRWAEVVEEIIAPLPQQVSRYHTLIHHARIHHALIHHARIHHALIHHALIHHALIHHALIHHARMHMRLLASGVGQLRCRWVGSLALPQYRYPCSWRPQLASGLAAAEGARWQWTDYSGLRRMRGGGGGVGLHRGGTTAVQTSHVGHHHPPTHPHTHRGPSSPQGAIASSNS
jgi:arginase family enzyme